MDTTDHSLATLFSQLGLPNSNADIESFLSDHSLASNESLVNGAFWTGSQKAFFSEALEEDSDWAEMVDQLDARLRK